MTPVLQLTRDEIIEKIEKAAFARRNISAEELLQAHRKGELEDPGEVADILALAALLPDDDPLLA